MTIRDIAVAFGFEVDHQSEAQAQSSIQSLKDMATKLLGSIAVVFSISQLSGFAQECVAAASNVQEMQNKFDVVFDGINEEVEEWAANFADSVGRNRNTIKTYLADQQNLLVGFGMTREEGAKLSEEMTTLALDLASFANLDETMAVNNMTKAVMGESEAAKSLGAVLNDVTRAETMAAMGISGKYDKAETVSGMMEAISGWISAKWEAMISTISGALETTGSIVSAKWNEISATVSSVMQIISATISSIWNSITGAVSEKVNAVRQLIVDGFNAAKNFIVGLAGEARQWGADLIDNLVSGIRSKIQRVADAVTGVADKIRSFLHFSVPDEGPLADMQSWMPDFMGGLASGIVGSSDVLMAVIASLGTQIKETFATAFENAKESAISGMSGIGEAVSSGFSGAVAFLESLPAQALRWGVDFINGLRDGILSGVSAIVGAVQNVADSIRSYLHFSVPDKGPLKDYESWMPDFTSGLARSFEGGEESILDKIRDLASDISLLTSAATAKATTAATTMVSNQTSSVTQNVNITNAYSGSAVEGARNVTAAMKKSAYDATAYMARGLAYAR